LGCITQDFKRRGLEERGETMKDETADLLGIFYIVPVVSFNLIKIMWQLAIKKEASP
jgi:hypothetical protein